jgi:hypothetical protein
MLGMNGQAQIEEGCPQYGERHGGWVVRGVVETKFECLEHNEICAYRMPPLGLAMIHAYWLAAQQ